MQDEEDAVVYSEPQEGKVPAEQPEEHVLYLAVTADGTEIQKNVSFTPVTSKFLNFDMRLRSLMSNIRLHAVFPPSVKDYNNLFEPFVEELYTHRPGGGMPIRMRHPDTNKPVHLYVHLAYLVNDIRGQTACTGGKSAPCFEGSCAMCKVIN